MTQQNLAGTLYAQGDLAGARTLYGRALEALTRLLGAKHPATLTTQQNLAGTLQAQGDLTGARVLVADALALARSHLGEAVPIRVSLERFAKLLEGEPG